MKRIFIAVKINPQNKLLQMAGDFKMTMKEESIKWTDTSNMHITIAFLGDTDEERINEIIGMAEAVCDGSGEFDLVLRGAGVFRRISDPRIIFAGIEPSQKLNNLFVSIRSGLKGIGIAIEERPFNPHLTLGRIKNLRDTELLTTLISRYDNSEIQNQKVTEIILYESLLFPAGAVYKPLAEFPL